MGSVIQSLSVTKCNCDKRAATGIGAHRGEIIQGSLPHDNRLGGGWSEPRFKIEKLQLGGIVFFAWLLKVEQFIY